MQSKWSWNMRLGLGVALVVVLTLTRIHAAEMEEAIQKRLAALNLVTGNDAISGSILELIKDEPGTKKLLEAAKEKVKKAERRSEVFTPNATLILARASQAVKDHEGSELFYRINIDQSRKLESSQRLALAYSGLITALIEAKSFEKADRVYKEFQEAEFGDDIEPFKDSLRRRMVLQLARLGQLERANELVEKLIKDNPGNPLNLELKGRLLHEAGKLEEAATTYEKVMNSVRDNARLPKEAREEFADSILYRLSGVYVDLKQVDKAVDALRFLLERKPDDPTYNNDLGFILADHDMKLDEAEKLVRKAIEKDREERKKLPDLRPEDDKDNPAYLDSLGWVLYKKKQYAEAKKYLKQALEQEEGRHLEIYDHYADCLMKLGEKKEAIEAWKKGLATTIETRRDQIRKVAVEKKIADAEK